ncbi:hypothetical protein SKAU_G00355650 [Synaphobranchus kaupii]|uniref:Uncharacterized protein n=1 Tax=Synaphobranchus kaupii TaxID=118154 RepID=A0A9Q1EH92_SYNKA|nr:hypothetical protein SKAU_G00355650 [Synaphobranchus kaupii]
MAYSCRVIVMFTVLALCKYSWAEWNVTQEATNDRNVSCGPHGNGSSNCTEMAETAKWRSSHFTRCPKEYKHYCIHGRCRFVREQNTPACICPRGYMGSSVGLFDILNYLHLHLRTSEKTVQKEEKKGWKNRGKTEHDEQHE